jgi:DNA-binding NarL/FixJ family response regulator
VNPYRIVVADDQPVFRQILKSLLASESEIEVVGEADDGLALLNLVRLYEVTPDLAILDLSMPGMSGIETARRIRTIYPGMKVLILTIHEEPYYINEAFTAGASGYLLKYQADTELSGAIAVIRNGQQYRPSLLAAVSERNAGL